MFHLVEIYAEGDTLVDITEHPTFDAAMIHATNAAKLAAATFGGTVRLHSDLAEHVTAEGELIATFKPVRGIVAAELAKQEARRLLDAAMAAAQVRNDAYAYAQRVEMDHSSKAVISHARKEALEAGEAYEALYEGYKMALAVVEKLDAIGIA